jgi:uncharacterized protein YbdZ (MbtH family)
MSDAQADMSRWEKVALRTERLPIPGGWLYRVDNSSYNAVSLAFVPDPSAEHCRPEKVKVPEGWRPTGPEYRR